MAETEVTQGQWRKLMENDPSYSSECGDEWSRGLTLATRPRRPRSREGDQAAA